ncbi:hypothetical protein VP424E501_P0095 [Vibrio phage 424E50-1]|nr:hypothetical protein VP424E501_P0095 [Vibrio phage 424E50-1]
MTLTQAQKLLKLYDLGYNIYRNINYVDGNMKVWEDEKGVIKYSSQIWAEDELITLPTYEIELSIPVENWEEL